MFLCALDGKIYDDKSIYMEVILRQKDKDGDTFRELPCKACCLCYGLLSGKYEIKDGNKLIVPPENKVKVFKISSTNFENKNTEKKNKKLADKPQKKLITEILKRVDTDIIKKEKKSKKYKNTLP